MRFYGLIAPDSDRSDPLLSVKRYWDLSQLLPLPRVNLTCPVCRLGNIDNGCVIIRRWMFHTHNTSTGSKYPARCDVMFKCCECSATWTHGVVVPEEMYQAAHKASKISVLHREARPILERGSF